MFGRSVPEFQPTLSDRAQGIPALEQVVEGIGRAIDSGRLTRAEPWPGAVSVWASVHGVVSLELDGYLGADPRFEAVPTLRRVMHQLMVGLGDDPDLASASVAASRP
jgi:hypothetical protein